MVPAIVDSTAAEATIPFVGGAAGAFGFGGGVIDAPSHFGARVTGQLERQPHNNVHRTISGTMGTAASPLDPIFWLHHAQVDRLWGRWLRLGGGRSDPSDVRWLDQRISSRPEPNEGPPDTARRALDHGTRLPLRGRSTADRGPAVGARFRSSGRGAGATEDDHDAARQSGGAGRLGTARTRSRRHLREHRPGPSSAGARQGARGARTSPSTAALIVEGIALDDPATPTYEVYLNMSDVGAGGQHGSSHFVGFLEFFGIDHEHGEQADHTGGAKRVFDITSLVYQLPAAGRVGPGEGASQLRPGARLRGRGDRSSGPPIDGEPGVHIGDVRIVVE